MSPKTATKSLHELAPPPAPASPTRIVYPAVLYVPAGLFTVPYELHNVMRGALCRWALAHTPVTETLGGRKVLETSRGSVLDRLYPCTQWTSRRLCLAAKPWLDAQSDDWPRVLEEAGGRLLLHLHRPALALFIM